MGKNVIGQDRIEQHGHWYKGEKLFFYMNLKNTMFEMNLKFEIKQEHQ